MAEESIPEGSLLIAHLADTHLRDTQYAAARRGIDFFDAFKRAVSVACDRADVLVLVGDIFDRPRPSPRVIGQLMQIDRLLKARGKICYAVTGNHDWCEPTWMETLFPAQARNEPGIVPIDNGTAVHAGFVIAGVLPHTANKFRNHMAETEVHVREADVVLYHGFVDGVVPFYAGENPLHCDEFPVSKNNKAWLLGDIHVQGYRELDRPGGGKCLTGYPGSLEMCSASEPTEKGVPILKLTRESCTVEEIVPLEIRPFVRAEVTTEEELDALMEEVAPVADKHPVVVVKFARNLPQTINRLHSTLDAQRAVVRCFPLPEVKEDGKAGADEREEESLSMEHFVSRRFGDDEELESFALDLLHRGESDATGITAAFVEQRLEAVAVREDD